MSIIFSNFAAINHKELAENPIKSRRNYIYNMEANQENLISGTCGENLKWYFNEEDKILTIEGSGEMDSFDEEPAPWSECEIRKVILPQGLLNIGKLAFEECTKLTSIEIPKSVTIIDAYAFTECKSLTFVKIPNSVTNIEHGAFYGCSNLKLIKIPDSVMSIGDSAFGLCSSLTSLVIPESVIYIGENAFWECVSIESITCASNVPPMLGDNVFEDVDKSITVKVPQNYADVYKNTKQWCDFTDIQCFLGNPMHSFTLSKWIYTWYKHRDEDPYKTSLILDDIQSVRAYVNNVADELSNDLKIQTTVREVKASSLLENRDLGLSVDSSQLGILLITELEACTKELGRKLTMVDLNVFYSLSKREHPYVNSLLKDTNWIVILTGKPFDTCDAEEADCLETITSDIRQYVQRPDNVEQFKKEMTLFVIH